jgi:hypothetical protein
MDIDKVTLQGLFDIAVGSMDFGSGFLDIDDVKVLRKVAELLGVDPSEGTPGPICYRHLWHQDCALPWWCGKPSNDPIHNMTPFITRGR